LDRLGGGIVSLAHTVTIVGWIVISLAIAAMTIGALVSRGRFPTAVALLHNAMRHIAVRVFVFASFAWIGWHFFDRTSR
jgi:hypothetical protein